METTITLAEQVVRIAGDHAKFKAKDASSYMEFALSLSHEAEVARARVNAELGYQEKRTADSSAVADLWSAYAKKYTVGTTSFDKYSATGDYLRLGMAKHNWTTAECLALLAAEGGTSFLQNEKRIGGLKNNKDVKCNLKALRAAEALTKAKEKLSVKAKKAEAKAKAEKAKAKAEAIQLAADNAKLAGGSLEAKIGKIAEILLANGSTAHLSVGEKLGMANLLNKLANHVKNEADLQKATIKAEKVTS